MSDDERTVDAGQVQATQTAANPDAQPETVPEPGEPAPGEPAPGEPAPRAPASPQLRMPQRGSVAPEPPAGPDPRLVELEGQLAESQRQFQRLAADFENYRRRMASEKDELVRFASGRVLENFLPIVDNFERALAHAATSDAANLLKGVDMIYRQVVDFLGRQGVAAMESVGQIFNPEFHEAIGAQETTEHPDNSVLIEVQKGYYLNGRVLRHAMVQVASNPLAPHRPVESPPEPASEPEPGPPSTPPGPEPGGDNGASPEGTGPGTGADSLTQETTAGSPAEAPPDQAGAPTASGSNEDHDFTLEDLLGEAQAPEGSKEETHG